MTTKKIDLPRVKTPANYFLFPQKKEETVGPSMTVPDESYTVEQILNKFTKGINLNIGYEPEYSDSDDFEDTDNEVISDLTDIQRLAAAAVAKEIRERRKAAAGRTSRGGATDNKSSDNDGVKDGKGGATPGDPATDSAIPT